MMEGSGREALNIIFGSTTLLHVVPARKQCYAMWIKTVKPDVQDLITSQLSFSNSAIWGTGNRYFNYVKDKKIPLEACRPQSEMRKYFGVCVHTEARSGPHKGKYM
jgi:hypothetical protein